MTAAGICTLDGLVGRDFRCIVADPPWAYKSKWFIDTHGLPWDGFLIRWSNASIERPMKPQEGG